MQSASDPAVPGLSGDAGRDPNVEGVSRAEAALAGAVAVAAGLGAAELAAGALSGARSLVVAVGDVVIDSVPGWLERAAIAVLGTADKPLLLAATTILAALAGCAIGVIATRRFAPAAAALAALALVGGLAELRDPRAETFPVLVVAGSYAVASILGLRVLLRAARTPPSGDVQPSQAAAVSRRRFLQQAVALASAAALAGIVGNVRAGLHRLDEIRSAIRLPQPARLAPPAPAAASLGISEVAPLYTPNDDFYRIDTALSVPKVDPAEWSLTVRGRVARPFRLTYRELMNLPHIEADITLACVSNEVGGKLVGNARWQGVSLRSLLERAGVQKGATQIVGRSVDGFTAGFPTANALASEDAMVAVAMNGEPLPIIHGFPARLVVPGLYGYVSATKWLSALELTTWSETVGYWVPRGWAARGPIKTQARIDVPSAGSKLPPGPAPIAGVAWAPTRGIDRVEVRIDAGPWVQAKLADSLDIDCWRQWVHPWNATPGKHRISVRATDGRGEIQTAIRADVAPSGATGHHTIEIAVESE